MNSIKKKIFLFTDGFPYGKGEKTFIIQEISELKKFYDLTIISRVKKSTFSDKYNVTKLDDNIKNLVVHEDNKICLLWYSFIAIFDKLWYEEVIRILRLKKKIIRRILSSTLFYARAKRYQHLIEKYNLFDDVDNSIYYTFWNNHMTLALCFEKQKRKGMKIISRIHGYDLYNERLKSGRQQFKEYIDKYENKLIFACEYGKNYYIKNFINNSVFDTKKYLLSRIGIKDRYKKTNKKYSTFVLVSCSNIIKIKRINLIIDALTLIPDNVKINWIHFGDGSKKENIIKYAYNKLKNKTNVKYDFYGYIKNEELIKWYQNNYVDCFITTTSTEGGCPVSVTEAMMFGIPIIGTDVGGVTEQIKDFGVLLNANPSEYEVLHSIMDIYNCKDILNLRLESRKNFLKKFVAYEDYCILFTTIS